MKRSYEKSQFIESVRQSHIYLYFNMLLQRKSLYDGLLLTLNEMILVVKWESEKSLWKFVIQQKRLSNSYFGEYRGREGQAQSTYLIPFRILLHSWNFAVQKFYITDLD